MPELKDTYPLYLNNKAAQPNTDLEVTDKFTGEVAFRTALASPEMVSTINRAGCPALSMARRTAGMSLVTPVEVSLCTTQTALIWWSTSSLSRASIMSACTP